MRSLRSMLSATVAGGALFAVAATPARADGRTLFTWSGTVDREAVIVMRGAMLETRGDGFNDFRDARYRVSEALPRAFGSVSIARADGRGDVEVIEQPSPFNGYTARVRVRDRQSGADRYRLVVTWEGARGDDRRGGRDDDGGNDGRNDGRNTGRNTGRDDGGFGRGDDRRGNDRRDDDRRDRDGRYGRSDDVGGGRDAGALRISAAVDDVVEIRIRGRRVDVVTRSGREVFNVRYDVRGAGLPAYAVPLDLRRYAGRGNAVIAQYPRDWNNWTAVIRIDDSRGGVDGYDLDLRW